MRLVITRRWIHHRVHHLLHLVGLKTEWHLLLIVPTGEEDSEKKKQKEEKKTEVTCIGKAAVPFCAL